MIGALKIDSRQVMPGDIFFDVNACTQKPKHELYAQSLRHIVEAYRRGASQIFTDKLFTEKLFENKSFTRLAFSDGILLKYDKSLLNRVSNLPQYRNIIQYYANTVHGVDISDGLQKPCDIFLECPFYFNLSVSAARRILNRVTYTPNAHLELREHVYEKYLFKDTLYKMYVTGTNGKTSCVYYFKQLSDFFDMPSMYVGTLGNSLTLDKVLTEEEIEELNSSLTTNSILTNYQLLTLGEITQKKSIGLEISSHGFSQNRMKGIKGDCFIMTTLGSDHLDYHKTIENYIETKLSMICSTGTCPRASSHLNLWTKSSQDRKYFEPDNKPTYSKYKPSNQLKLGSPVIITNQIYQNYFLPKADMVDFILNHHQVVILKSNNIAKNNIKKVTEELDTKVIQEEYTSTIAKFNFYNFVTYTHEIKNDGALVIINIPKSILSTNIESSKVKKTKSKSTKYLIDETYCTLTLKLQLFTQFQIENFLLSFLANIFNLKSNGMNVLDKFHELSSQNESFGGKNKTNVDGGIDKCNSVRARSDERNSAETRIDKCNSAETRIDERDVDERNNVKNCINEQNIGAQNNIEIDFSSIKSPPGRMESIRHNDNLIFIDYAHNPEGLETALINLKSVCKGKLVVIFGCGGDRDKLKRTIMGKIAGLIADHVIITDDNPRNEDPDEIRKTIAATVPKSKLKNIGCRKKAIIYGIQMLSHNDILLIAGKGDENYQLVNGQKLKFNDREEVLRFIS